MFALAARSREFVAKLIATTLVMLCCLTAATAAAETPLRVCLQSNDPPLSARGGGEPTGFDLVLSRRIAERLGRSLAIQWFVTRDDPDSNPETEADALLTDGHCNLVAGYPLVADKLGRPRSPTGRLPPFEGATAEDRRRWITLGELAPTRAYRVAGITVALSPSQAGRQVHSLQDLATLRLGVTTHSLPDLIATGYRGGALTDHLMHFNQPDALLQELSSGTIDAALLDIRALDAWQLAHPTTNVTATGYVHSFGFNIGFVALSSDGALIRQVDAALADLLQDGSLAEMARAAGMTYLAPRQPDVLGEVTLGSLLGD
jgi:ABC-type amino acid transport substrate-binding protein